MVKDEFARAALEVTRKWAIEELEAARVRATNMRCGGESYNSAIRAIDDLTYMIGRIDNDLNNKKPTYSIPGDEEAEPQPVMEDPAEPEIAEILPAAKNDPEPEPEPTEPERPIPKLEDVRGKCGEAKKAGVDIKGILNDLGYNNLSSVDPKDYNTLLDKVNAALEEIG